MHIDERRKIYNESYEQKLAYAHKNKQIHIPRYWIVVIWGLFITFVVYAYALISLNDIQKSSDSIGEVEAIQKVKTTIEFLPNEPEPQFVQMPVLN